MGKRPRRPAPLGQVALLLLLLAGVVTPRAFASDAEISLPDYISALDRCSQTLDRFDPNAAAPNAAALRELRSTLPAEWKVRDGSGTYTVDTKWLADALDGLTGGPASQQQARLAATKQHLAALRDSAEGLKAENSRVDARAHEEQQARAKLDKILHAREFQGAHGPSWFDQLKSRFYDWIQRQRDKLHLPRSQAFGNTLAWLVIALAVGLVALWAVRGFVRGRAADMNLRGAAAPGRDWRYWLREARGAAERGDYRAAIHAAYWAGVARMEEADLLPEDRARTPRESLRLVRKESSEYAPLAALTRSFELVWYGYRAATESDWNDARQQLERLENARVPRPA